LKSVFYFGILFEFLLFFLLFDNNLIGISLTIGKFFLLVFYILNFKKIFDFNVPLLKEFVLIFLYSVLSIFFPFLYYDVFILNKRFLLEPFLYLIYYFIFVVTTYNIVFINDKKYFFKIIKYLILFLLCIGYLDFFLYIINIDLIPRHISDGRNVGQRFHSLFGEPRDAFVCLIGIIFFINYYKNYFSNIIYKSLFLLIILALLLTKSLSGIIGIFFGFILYTIFIPKSRKILIYYILVASFLYLFIFIALSDPRMELYLEQSKNLFYALERSSIPPVFEGQIASILPFFKIIQEIFNNIYLFIVFGHGNGTSSQISSKFIGQDNIAYPASQLIRIFFELGLVGIFLWLKLFSKLKKVLRINNNITFLIFCLFVGSYLSHRSNSFLIIIGLILGLNKTIFYNASKN